MVSLTIWPTGSIVNVTLDRRSLAALVKTSSPRPNFSANSGVNVCHE
jgi:hypothetical protein